MPRRLSSPARLGRRWTSGLALAIAIAAVGEPAPLAAQTGSITGRVELEAQPPRRSAGRYGQRGGSAETQAIPAVVYLLGSIPGAAPGPASAEMVQRDTAFAPAAVMVGMGASVDFPNDDPFFHNVFSYSSTQRFDLGRYPQGESKAVTFDDVGVVDVYCEVHDRMRGAIIVTENPFHAVVAEDGSFRIDGVPAGEYTVAFWSADHDAAEETVTVTAGGTTTVEVELRR